MMIKSEESPASPDAVPDDPVVPEESETAEKTNKTTNPRPKPNYPRTSEMVNLAIKALSEKNGSSLQAIKKYMVDNYKIDVEKQNLFIKKYLKSAVEAGFLIRTKGRGAAGSFKIPGHKIDPLKIKSKTKPKAAKKAPPRKTTPAKSTPKKGKTSPKKSPKKGGEKSGNEIQGGQPKSAPKAKTSAKKSVAKSPKTKKVTSPKAKKIAPSTEKDAETK